MGNADRIRYLLTVPTTADVVRSLVFRAGPFFGLVTAWIAVAAVVLIPLGIWTPLVVVPVLAVGTAVAWRVATAFEVPTATEARHWVPWAHGFLALGFGLWSGLTHAENVVLRRDPGSYALYAQWIATRHRLPISGDLGSFGGSAVLNIAGFTIGSPAYYQESVFGHTFIIPQFLPGAPAWYSLGYWAAGWTGLFLVPAVLGAIGVLAVGGLASKLVGPRWALLAAAAFGAAFPVMHVNRTTFSEPVSVLVIATVAVALIQATARSDPRMAQIAGLLLGLGLLVRIDSLTEITLSVPVVALAARSGFPARAFYRGLAWGSGIGIGGALLLSGPYLQANSSSILHVLFTEP